MANWWETHPWRFIQTNLRETDMIDIDAKIYVDELKEFGATIAMINTGGIIASYKTDLPFHYQSPFLKGDSLQKIIEACHSEGIKVMARNDFSKIRRPLYEQHPEWAYRTTDGGIVDYNGDVHSCVNSEYQQIYSFKITNEIIDRLDIDGIFFNWGGYLEHDYSYNHYGICHCDSCKRLFREMYGLILPHKADMNDLVYRKYRVFQRITLKNTHEKMVALIRSKRPDIAINKEDFYRQESHTEYGEPLPHWQYSSSSNTRWVRSTYPRMRCSNTTVDFIGFYYRHIAVNPAQQELRLWQSIANTGELDYYLIGRLDNHHDKSGFEGIKRVFRYHERNEKYYANLKSRADILLVRNSDAGGNNEGRGWIRILTEKHFLFDEVLANGLHSVNPAKYKAVVLAHAQFISDADAKAIDDYAKSGGIVIATGESGLHDNMFEPREYNSLKCLGISGHVSIRDDMRGAMLLIDDIKDYPTFAEWKTDVIYFGDSFLSCDYDATVQKHLKLIPPHNYGPPERCYFTQITDLPGMTVNPYGRGKGVHIPWYPGALFLKEGYVNTIAFIGDVLSQLLGILPVETNLSPMVEVTVSEGEGFTLVQLVNTSGHFGTTFYEPVKMHDIWMSIPFEAKPHSCISLLDGRSIKFEHKDNRLEIAVGDLDFFDAVKIDQ